MRSKARNLGITEVYERVADSIPEGLRGSSLVLQGYNWYQENYDTSSSSARKTNGDVLECLILDALWLDGIRPAYHQAAVANVPNVIFDIFLYHPVRPASISCKTSLRERWKQADLEGLALKQVYRAARSILVTLSTEGHRVQKHIDDSNVLGLDQCIVIEEGQSAFDCLLAELRSERFIESQKILPVTAQNVMQ